MDNESITYPFPPFHLVFLVPNSMCFIIFGSLIAKNYTSPPYGMVLQKEDKNYMYKYEVHSSKIKQDIVQLI